MLLFSEFFSTRFVLKNTHLKSAIYYWTFTSKLMRKFYETSSFMRVFTIVCVFCDRFCKAAAFDSRQTSTLLSIMNEIFLYDAGANTLKNNVTESFQRFQVLLLKHSVERPPKRYTRRQAYLVAIFYIKYIFL